MTRHIVAALCVTLTLTSSAGAQDEAVHYRVTFPEPEHHWLQVDAMFTGLGPEPFRARMSRSSPGRYAVHEFAKNVFSVQAFDGGGRPLVAARVDADEWQVASHGGSVRLVYRVFGDQADGTYLAVDTTHAHLNMPATFMWAPGLEMRPIRIAFTPPEGSRWRVASQLFATADPQAFTAPNLQYFMDSPTELSEFVDSTFTLPNPDNTMRRFRIVVHSDASQADVDALAVSVERLVREQMTVFGEFPVYEPDVYTFLVDYLPWVEGDGMEHRNSTSISIPGTSFRSADARQRVLETVAHEFFHNWNVERIRPAGLEPFDFRRENVTCCLWLAEGFTRSFGDLLLARAALSDELPVNYVAAVMNAPGRSVRSAVEMSEQAPFADAGVSNDLTDESRTFVSSYAHGAAIALALDLSLRERSSGQITLDDYMRALWQRFGREVDPRPGFVARPYSLADLRDVLGDLTRDTAFARDFFARYVSGRQLPDYAHLLGLVGYAVVPIDSSRGWVGVVSLTESSAGLRVGARQPGARNGLVAFDTPLYEAGVDEGDVITAIDGARATMARWNAIAQRTPGDRIPINVERRDGSVHNATLLVRPDPRVRILSVTAGAGAVVVQTAPFREAWAGSKVR